MNTMPDTPTPLQRRWNWPLSLNILVLIINASLIIFLFTSSRLARSVNVRAEQEASEMNMTLLGAKESLSVFMDNDFPRNRHFKLFDSSRQLFIEGQLVSDQTIHRDATDLVLIGLGTNTTLFCYYSKDKNPEPRLHEIVLALQDSTLFDYNADGCYDLRTLNPTGTPSVGLQVWLDGKWEDVNRDGVSSQYRKHLQKGGAVEFDMKSGRWRSADSKTSPSDKPNASKNGDVKRE